MEVPVTLRSVVSGGELSHRLHGGRRLLDVFSDNPTYKWAIIAAAVLVALLLILGISLLIWWQCCRTPSARVAPAPPTGDANSKQAQDLEMGMGQGGMLVLAQQLMPPSGCEPIPPWEQYGLPPPGIMLSPLVPTNFNPFSSNPRPPSAPAYERLVLVSSRVHQPMKVAEAVLPNVAVVVYDWKLFTLQELLLHIKRAIGAGGKVTSIAVVAPGNKPGCVALLEGCTTSADKLANGGGELGQFWRVLAGCVAANGVADGRRVDLLGCRVVEAPQEGAALLKSLWSLTSVPFAAADDALGGYQLSTFLEEPSSGALSIISSTIKGIDVYFNRYTLLGIEPPGASAPGAGLLPPLPNAAYAPPMPAGAPPAGALAFAVGYAPLPATPGAMQLDSAAAAPPPPPPKDIFARFTESLKALGLTTADVFARHDKDKSGWLSPDEIVSMVAAVVPGTSQLDTDHFRSMLDIDGNRQITQAEFAAGLDSNKKATEAAKSGRDETSLMRTLHDYLTDNDLVIRNYFDEADANKTGTLDHTEVVGLIAQIPGLDVDERKRIASYLYQLDTTGKGLLTFDQLKHAVKSYGTPAAQAAVAAPRPGALVATASPATASTAAVPGHALQAGTAAVAAALAANSAAPVQAATGLPGSAPQTGAMPMASPAATRNALAVVAPQAAPALPWPQSVPAAAPSAAAAPVASQAAAAPLTVHNAAVPAATQAAAAAPWAAMQNMASAVAAAPAAPAASPLLKQTIAPLAAPLAAASAPLVAAAAPLAAAAQGISPAAAVANPASALQAGTAALGLTPAVSPTQPAGIAALPAAAASLLSAQSPVAPASYAPLTPLAPLGQAAAAAAPFIPAGGLPSAAAATASAPLSTPSPAPGGNLIPIGR